MNDRFFLAIGSAVSAGLAVRYPSWPQDVLVYWAVLLGLLYIGHDEN
jgi:hypothetical protein